MSAPVLLVRCATCRRGLTAMQNPALRCSYCDGRMWKLVHALTLLDRWRLWRQTGLAPWTSPAPLPE